MKRDKLLDIIAVGEDSIHQFKIDVRNKAQGRLLQVNPATGGHWEVVEEEI